MMKLSEFVLTHTKGGPLNREYFAEVSVTTGFLWWKRTERRKIYRECIGFWRFLDSGEFTPVLQAERLERAYRARESLRLLEQ
jgi:hypothetical protein